MNSFQFSFFSFFNSFFSIFNSIFNSIHSFQFSIHQYSRFCSIFKGLELSSFIPIQNISHYITHGLTWFIDLTKETAPLSILSFLRTLENHFAPNLMLRDVKSEERIKVFIYSVIIRFSKERSNQKFCFKVDRVKSEGEQLLGDLIKLMWNIKKQIKKNRQNPMIRSG